MYQFFRKIYLLLPFKNIIFHFLKNIYKPSPKLSGYLKFKGKFNFQINKELKVKIYNDQSTLPTLLFWQGLEGYEPASLRLWVELSKNAEMILDVGANIGIFGLIAKKVNPKTQVILFEPLERNISRIKKNFQINDLEAIFEQLAIADFDGKTTFYDMDISENTIGSLDKSFVESHLHHKKIVPIEVPVKTLDTYIKENNISKIDLIKIDVEGVDFEVIKGFLKTIQKDKPNILIEITSENTAHKTQKLIENLNIDYHFFEIDEKQGLIKTENIEKKTQRNYLLHYRKLN